MQYKINHKRDTRRDLTMHFPPLFSPSHALLLWVVISLPYLGRSQKDE